MLRTTLLSLLIGALCWAQPDDSRPAASNVRGAEYPRVHADLRVTFHIKAPDARNVQLQPGGDWAITETTPADPALDMRSAIGLTNILNADERITNRWIFTP